MQSTALPTLRQHTEDLPAGGFRSTKQDTYRTKDGRAEFQFRFVPQGNHFEIDILKQPRYGLRKSDLHNTHRLPSDRGGHRICLGDPSAAGDLNAAYKWAAMWAEHTWKYIATGTPFPNDDNRREPAEVTPSVFEHLSENRLWREIASWPLMQWVGYMLLWWLLFGVLSLIF